MKTTVDIPAELLSEVRKLAAARRQPVAVFISEELQKLVMTQSPLFRGKGRKNGQARRTSLAGNAARWLSEWRALAQPKLTGGQAASSAADVVSRMRR